MLLIPLFSLFVCHYQSLLILFWIKATYFFNSVTVPFPSLLDSVLDFFPSSFSLSPCSFLHIPPFLQSTFSPFYSFLFFQMTLFWVQKSSLFIGLSVLAPRSFLTQKKKNENFQSCKLSCSLSLFCLYNHIRGYIWGLFFILGDFEWSNSNRKKTVLPWEILTGIEFWTF